MGGGVSLESALASFKSAVEEASAKSLQTSVDVTKIKAEPDAIKKIQ